MSGLIVPVDVIAYCVGTLDAHGPVRDFAGATTNYANQVSDNRPAFLGINVTRDASVAPMWPMEAGVHLHWAMPDALTRADTSSGQMRFPALPNRWLVSRVVGNAQSAKHWIIRSDALSPSPPGGKPAPTVPVAEPAATPAAGGDAAAQRGYRYLGAWEVFTPEWAEPGGGAETMRAMTGAELHAVATGDIAFAAFYPNSRSSFGFHDDLTDLAGPAELMYVVSGWYDTPAADPLQAGLTVAELQERLRWATSSGVGAAGVLVTYSTYSGLAQGIQWDPDTRYVPAEPEPIPADVAVGNNPAEALAAYFRGTMHPDLPAFEELLTLFVAGLLPDLMTPQSGQLASLAETLHEMQFTAIDGGAVYTIMRGADEVAELPLPLADALNLLNTRQQAADIAAEQVRQAKWELFSDWYRLFVVSGTDQGAALNTFNRQLGLLRSASDWRESAAADAATQRTTVEEMLSGDLTLARVPAPRYYRATDPVILLASDAAAVSERYGGDGRYHPNGYLACRLDTEVLRELRVGPVTLRASQFTALAPGVPNGLPYPEIAALVQEAALLDTAIDAAASGIDEPDLAADLVSWLEDREPARYYGHPVGVPPSPVAVGAWSDANPWMSLKLVWTTQFHPLLSTFADGDMVDYSPGFFTANYRLHPDSPGMIKYAPTADGIRLDPAHIDWDPGDKSGTCRYTGSSVLSPTATDNLRAQLAKYPTDPTLQEIARRLSSTDIAMQALAGFGDALLTREPSLQLAIGAGDKAPPLFRLATQQAIREIPHLSDIWSLAPLFNGNYSSVRAGYLKLSLQVMDPFGNKRPVEVRNLYLADSLTTRYEGKDVADVIYAQPRLAQESRLLYRWLAADSTEYDEMNAHPATTPVCGWLLPDHLSVGFFIYTAQGDPLGSLTLSADGNRIIWQATPGDQDTIDADLQTVMAYQNPHLSDVALALGDSTPPRFRAFWQAADAAVTQIAVSAPASQAGLAALVGRPLALVQASLRLERLGFAALDQTFRTLSDGLFGDTDHRAGDVGFPVVIGDLERIDDGLVGYFKQAEDGDHYDLAKFFSQAATGSDPGVVVPSPTNLLLTAAATPATAPDTPPAEAKLLMLVDPRAPVHATMGIVPTQSLAIPSDQYEDILAGLELTFPVFPLLRGGGGLEVPIPAIAGYSWSWITQEATPSGPEWAVDPALRQPTAGALWQYSPQTLTEGWLRLNPQFLRFRLTGPDGVPVVIAGQTTTLDLVVTNTRGAPITFVPAAGAGNAQQGPGSVFYVHFGSLVDPAQVGLLRFTAPGWRFELMTDAQHGSYWAALPESGPVTLAPGAQLSMTIANVAVAAGTRAQSRVYFDYADLVGIDDGVDVAILTIQQPSRNRGPGRWGPG
jgi:hypothetical protein